MDHQRSAGLVDVRRPRRGHRRRATSTPASSSTTRRSSPVPRQHGDGTFDHNYNWFDPSHVCGSPSLAPVRQQRPRHPHDGHDGRRRRRRQPDRRRARREVDRGQGLRVELLLDAALLRVGPVDARPDRPQRARTRGPTCARTSSTTPGAAARSRPVLPGDGRQAGSRPGIFPVFANGNAGPGLRHRRLAGRLSRDATPSARTTSTTRSRSFSAAAVGLGGGDQAEHLRAGRQRPLAASRTTATTASAAPRWPRRTWPARSR